MTGEFDLIRRHFSPATDHTFLAGGDDAALIDPVPGRQLAVSADMLVSGRHFLAADDPADIGYKALAVNLSDLAAMGALPRWATLAIALPEADDGWVAAFAGGFLGLAREHGVDLIGGDTTRGPLTIAVQIMGEVAPGRALRRDGARAGDDLWVTGTLGDAACALAQIVGSRRLDPGHAAAALARHYRPVPRNAFGLALVGLANSCIDVSDGFVADVGHIAQRSGVRIKIDWALVPLHPAITVHRADPAIRDAALAGGDDYELAFTAPGAVRDAIAEASARIGVMATRCGRVMAGAGVVAVAVDGDGSPIPLARPGFDHFR